MALTKTQKIDQIEIVGDFKTLQVREVTLILEDGEEISKKYHRTSYDCLTEISTLPTEELQEIAKAVWTQQIKDAYTSSQPRNQ